MSRDSARNDALCASGGLTSRIQNFFPLMHEAAKFVHCNAAHSGELDEQLALAILPQAQSPVQQAPASKSAAANHCWFVQRAADD